MLANWLDVAGLVQLRETVSEVADARNDEFLAVRLHQRVSIGANANANSGWSRYLCGGHVGGRLDPVDRVADFLDGIDEGADVAGHVVEEVNSRHD